MYVILNMLTLQTLELCCEIAVLSSGARIGYGTPKTLTNKGAKPCGDLMAFKPTKMASVPKVYETIRKTALEMVTKKGGITKRLFDTAYAKKLSLLNTTKSTPVWDALVFRKFRKVLGGRIDLLGSGGAPLSPETHKFLRICFSCPVIQGYGLTETCSSGCVQRHDAPFATETVGGPSPSCEIRLRDVPELGYFSTDKPYPRGEICIRGDCVALGYFKNPEKTAEDFKDGWFYTGDIGLWLPDGGIRIIDRKKNLIKLSHGEYVAVEYLESLYANSPFISNMFIHGNSYHEYIVAIAVPQEGYLKHWAKEKGIPGDYESLCNNPEVCLFKDGRILIIVG